MSNVSLPEVHAFESVERRHTFCRTIYFCPCDRRQNAGAGARWRCRLTTTHFGPTFDAPVAAVVTTFDTCVRDKEKEVG